MKVNDKQVLVDGLKKLAEDAVSLAAFVKALFPEEGEQQDGMAEAAAPAGTKDTAAEAPAKTYTYEEARAVLAEKSRTGHRAEVKAILTRHGVKQLSDAKDPAILAAIVAEAEAIPDA